MQRNSEYTVKDHEYRDVDHYALAKYRLSLRWLGRVGATGRLLNVGCGSGLFNDLAWKAGYSVVGAEPDPSAYELAIERAAGRYDVVNRGIFELDASLSADVVVMHDVLEHIDCEGAAVDALAALVRPGGVALVSVPALDSLFGHHDRQLGHFRRYSRTSLKRALQPRFEVSRSRYLGMSGIPVVVWFSRLKDEPYPMASTGGVMQKIISLACALEERIPSPIGTSVVALIKPRQ